MKKRWVRFENRLGLKRDDSERIFKKLRQSYRKPKRYYHTFGGHIAFCIDEFEKVRRFARNPQAVEVAIWFHDAVFGNEGASIVLMQELLQNTFVPEVVLGEAARLIRVTAHQEIPKDLDAMIVSGIDLLILGQPGKVFWRYDRNIRKEHEFVPNMLFCKRRADILGNFLKRSKIFYFPLFHQTSEGAARQNLALCIKKLKNS